MENDSQGNDYALKFLADMEAKYAALGNAIASVKIALNIGALGGLGANGEAPVGASPVPTPSGPVSLPRGAFLGKSIADAIRIYLNAVRARKGNREIATALKEGGAVSTGNFDNRINGALFQLKNRGEVLRFDDGWGLSEWYPESFRNRVGQDKPQTKKKKKAKTQAHSKTTIPGTKTTPAPKDDKPKIKLGVQIEGLLQTNPSGLNKESIATMLGANVRVVDMLMAKLTAKGVVEKMPSGDYRSTKLREMPKAV